MPINRRGLALVLLVVLAVAYELRGFRGFATGSVAAARPVLGPEPEQTPLAPKVRAVLVRDGVTYTVEHTHQYRLVGQVVAASTYALTFTNGFYDVDLGLVWGDQVEALVQKLTFRQDHRWLFWRTDGPLSDADRAQIEAHVGNQHIIPADDSLDRAVRAARIGDVVVLEGTLVTIEDSAGRTLARSSTSRTDTGGGACEIVWLTAFQNGTRRWTAPPR